MTTPWLFQIVLKFGVNPSTFSSQILPKSDTPTVDLSIGYIDIRRQIAAQWLKIAQWPQRIGYMKVTNETTIALSDGTIGDPLRFHFPKNGVPDTLLRAMSPFDNYSEPCFLPCNIVCTKEQPCGDVDFSRVSELFWLQSWVQEMTQFGDFISLRSSKHTFLVSSMSICLLSLNEWLLFFDRESGTVSRQRSNRSTELHLQQHHQRRLCGRRPFTGNSWPLPFPFVGDLRHHYHAHPLVFGVGVDVRTRQKLHDLIAMPMLQTSTLTERQMTRLIIHDGFRHFRHAHHKPNSCRSSATARTWDFFNTRLKPVRHWDTPDEQR